VGVGAPSARWPFQFADGRRGPAGTDWRSLIEPCQRTDPGKSPGHRRDLHMSITTLTTASPTFKGRSGTLRADSSESVVALIPFPVTDDGHG
jgi:hypothetical protein